MFILLYLYIYIFVKYIHIYMCFYISIYIYIIKYIHIYIYVFLYIYIYIYIAIYTYIYSFTLYCVYKHIHSYTHMPFLIMLCTVSTNSQLPRCSGAPSLMLEIPDAMCSCPWQKCRGGSDPSGLTTGTRYVWKWERDGQI